MFGREGISYFREITQLIQINPITLSLYDPTAKISDHTFLVFYPTILVFYPTIRGKIPLFYYYIIIPLLLFLSSPTLVEVLGSRVLKGGGDAEEFGPHSGPHRKELAVSAVAVVAEYLEHYQTCQWSDINIKQKDGYVHDELQVRHRFSNALVKQSRNFLNTSES